MIEIVTIIILAGACTLLIIELCKIYNAQWNKLMRIMNSPQKNNFLNALAQQEFENFLKKNSSPNKKGLYR